MAKTTEPDVFVEALKNRKNISNEYYDDIALRNQLSGVGNFTEELSAFRDIMQDNGGIHRIANADAALQTQLEQQHLEGHIGAVDGTAAINLTEVNSQTVYGVGVISITTQTVSSPCINMTASRLNVGAGVARNKNADLIDVITQLERFVTDQSWPQTFREYAEREEALRLLADDEATLVLLDGPLYTQNLLTQTIARNGLLEKMLAQEQQLIGFIKELSSSKVMAWAGMALRSGEYWTVERWRDLLSSRLKTGAAATWLENRGTRWVRTIYRVRERAFAFECHPDLVSTGVAIVNSPAMLSDAVNHELPYLLETADSILRARMSAKAKSANLIFDSIHHANLTNEGEFRQ
jgi:hypothetical protein